MTYILIIFMTAPGMWKSVPQQGGVAIHSIEFSSENACDLARRALMRTNDAVTNRVSSVCVKK